MKNKLSCTAIDDNNKSELEEAISFNQHAIFMSRLAINILEGNNNMLNLEGVREIIAMYLLVPYITNNQLCTPNDKCNIPKLDIKSVFTGVYNKDGSISNMTLDGLRNAICHSFVSVVEGKGLLLDDRASCNRDIHNKMTDKGFCNRLEILKTRKKLFSLHKQVINQQLKFNKNLLLK